MAQTFGTTGVTAEWGDMAGVSFTNPIKAKGTIYVTLVYPSDFDLTIQDENIGSSYIGLGAVLHSSGASSLMVKPDSVPEGSMATAGNWCMVDELDSKMKGYGL